jgi:DNA-binding transcriptional LysR family regulator
MQQNWDDMRYFLALCRTHSFVSAAHELKVTHSTVARRISALEGSLQTLLFQRTERGCRLTPAGEMLLPYAERLESTVITIEECVSGKDKELSGSIRIGAPDGIGNCFLAARLCKFQSQHPGLEVELIPVPMYYSLSKREIDISITVRKPTAGNVIARRLTSYRLGLFSTREYLASRPAIATLEKLPGHRVIGYIDDLLFDQDLRFMEEFCPGLTVNFRSSTVVAQVQALAAGGGIGVIPYFMAHTEPALVPVLPEKNIERGYWLQINPDSRQLARVRTTIDFLVSQIEAEQDLFLSLPSGG